MPEVISLGAPSEKESGIENGIEFVVKRLLDERPIDRTEAADLLIHGLNKSDDFEREIIVEVAEKVFGFVVKDLAGDPDIGRWLDDAAERDGPPGDVIKGAGGVFGAGYQAFEKGGMINMDNDAEVLAVARLVKALMDNKPEGSYMPMTDKEVEKSRQKLTGIGAIVPSVLNQEEDEPVFEMVEEGEEPAVSNGEKVGRKEEEEILEGEVVPGSEVLREDVVVDDVNTNESSGSVEINTVNDETRLAFVGELDKLLFSGAAINEPVSADDVEIIFARLKIPKSFSNEALAITELMNASAAKRYFIDHPGLFNKDKKDMTPTDWQWKDLFMLAYQNRQLQEVLLEEELEESSQVLALLTRIMDLGRRNGNRDKFELVDHEDVNLYELIKEIDDDFVRQLLACGSGRVATGIEFERSMVRVAQEMLSRDGIVVGNYQARLGFMLYEGFVEAEKNKRHPLFQFTHTSEYSDVALFLGIWGGSLHWWDGDLREKIGMSSRTNMLPDRLWKSPLLAHEGLGELIEKRKGAMAIKALLRFPESRLDGVVLKRGTKPGEGIVVKVMESVAKSNDAMKCFSEFGENVESSLIDEQGIWKLLGILQLCNGVDDEQTLLVIEAATLVLFKEISVHDTNADRDVGGKVVRAVSPFGLWERFTRLAIRRRVKAAAGRPEIYKGIFEVFIDEDVKADPVEERQRIEKNERLKVQASQAFTTVRATVKQLIRDYVTINGGKWLERIPDADKVYTNVLEIGLPENYVLSYNDEFSRLKGLAGYSDFDSELEAGSARFAAGRQDLAHWLVPGKNFLSRTLRWLMFGSK